MNMWRQSVIRANFPFAYMLTLTVQWSVLTALFTARHYSQWSPGLRPSGQRHIHFLLFLTDRLAIEIDWGRWSEADRTGPEGRIFEATLHAEILFPISGLDFPPGDSLDLYSDSWIGLGPNLPILVESTVHVPSIVKVIPPDIIFINLSKGFITCHKPNFKIILLWLWQSVPLSQSVWCTFFFL